MRLEMRINCQQPQYSYLINSVQSTIKEVSNNGHLYSKLPISEELRQNFFLVRDYKRCLSIFSRLGRLNAKACAVFGDCIVKYRTRQDAIV
jgi:hypothetical protein